MTDTAEPSAPPSGQQRLLRRSRTDRVAAGVSSGLGEYFGVDPVLFRVLFATSAFFGGAGIIGYLVAWAAIPETGAERAPVDGWMAALRQRRTPVWIAAAIGGLLLWALAFSWWAPGPPFAVVAIVVLLAVFFSRRDLRPTAAPPTAAPPAVAPVDMTKPGNEATAPLPHSDVVPPPAPTQTTSPSWVHDARAWMDESRAAARERRRRAFPIRIGVLLVLVASLSSLAIADAVSGIQFQWYFRTTLIILIAAMVVAAATRRWSWSVVPLLVPAAVGAIAFAGSDASLHDGIGQREWKPVTANHAKYRLAFGQGVLDLRNLQVTGPTKIKVTMGAGQVRVIVPKTMNVSVHADVHAGQLEVNRERRADGFEFDRIVDPLPDAVGAPVTVDVHLADGNVSVERR